MALVVGTIAIAGARSVLGALADHADRINRVARESDRFANGERSLRALVGGLHIGAAGGPTFSGDEREAHFSTWCPTPAGWQERCRVRLVIVRADSLEDGWTVGAMLPSGELLSLIPGGPTVRFAYLRDAAAGGTWVRSWGAGITAPVAVGIMTERDTLIVRVGERG